MGGIPRRKRKNALSKGIESVARTFFRKMGWVFQLRKSVKFEKFLKFVLGTGMVRGNAQKIVSGLRLGMSSRWWFPESWHAVSKLEFVDSTRRVRLRSWRAPIAWCIQKKVPE